MKKSNSNMLVAAWTIALASTLGALFIGEVMGQMPCVLCWYQRIAMFPLAVVLGVAAFRNDTGVWVYAWPLAVAGLCVAAYHSFTYAGVLTAPITPCQATGPSCSGDGMLVFGIPIPFLSVAAFTAITLLVLPLARKSA